MTEVFTLTRTDAVIRTIGKVTKRIRQLEHDEASAFAELHAAQQAAREEGLSFDLELAPGLAASYSAWKQANAARAARELSRADWQNRDVAAAP